MILNPLAPQPSPDTTAWRVYHDRHRALWIDHFDGRWLVQTEGESLPAGFVEAASRLCSSLYWRPRDKAAATAPIHLAGEIIAERFPVRESGVSCWMDFSAGYSCGLFTDQRLNRIWVAEQCRPGNRILNTFAYTGAFSLVASRAGAETTTVDLSSVYLDWTWENFALNGLDRTGHHGARGDVFTWLRTFARQGRTFHGIVLDPPTFSRSGRDTFRTDRNYASLVSLAAAVLAPGGWMLCCANTHRLTADRFAHDVADGIRAAGRRIIRQEAPPMPPEFCGDDYLKTLRLHVE